MDIADYLGMQIIISQEKRNLEWFLGFWTTV